MLQRDHSKAAVRCSQPQQAYRWNRDDVGRIKTEKKWRKEKVSSKLSLRGVKKERESQELRRNNRRKIQALASESQSRKFEGRAEKEGDTGKKVKGDTDRKRE